MSNEERTEPTRASDFDTMTVESVSDSGRVTLRFFGGASMMFTVPREMIPYYRRLASGVSR